ncbi:MAG: hypothetical protein IGS39_01125 [Calothrix sp. C42_A2020_038]|nr:hypothetical protein [Calothrix sp. C42_A2020_038]
MARRFYVIQFGSYWSLPKQQYLKLLQHGAVDSISHVDLKLYQAREVKKPPVQAKPIDLTDFEIEHYQMELEHFLKTGEQTGLDVAGYVSVFFE